MQLNKTLSSIVFTILIVSIRGYSQISKTEAQAKITEAIISPSNAQELREFESIIKKGENIIVIKGISQFISEKSLQIKTENDILIQSIKVKVVAGTDPQKSDSIKNLRKRLTELYKKRTNEETSLSAIEERKSFLQANYNLSKNENLKPEVFKSLNEIISSNIKTLAFEYQERQNNLNELNAEIEKISRSIVDMNKRMSRPTGEITLKISANKDFNPAKFFISYITGKAGWTPSYDVKSESVNKPLSIRYKANVYQETGNDWKNVKLKFTNIAPSEFGNIPLLNSYVLPHAPYYSPEESVNKQPAENGFRNIRGTVVAGEKSDGIAKGDPLAGVTIVIKGSTRGTVTDIDGNFVLNNVPDNGILVISYIGYATQEIAAKAFNDYFYIRLLMDATVLEEVVATGYSRESYSPPGLQTTGALFGRKNKKTDVSNSIDAALQGRVAGVESSPKFTSENASQVRSGNRNQENDSKNTGKIMGSNYIEFALDKPVDLSSSDVVETIGLQTAEVPAEFSFVIIPKRDPFGYLNARIIDWSQLNLISGEANIYLENTFMGKTYLDVNNFSDTLVISLGKDRNVISKREKVKEFSKTSFIGVNKSSAFHYKISIRNNKQEEINIKVIDQYPISYDNALEVEKVEFIGAQQNKDTGKLEWNIKIAGQSTKDLDLKYTIKYPKYRSVHLE